ncbi:hypothetical protein [Deinococcus sp. Marseille-Q6407]|uniref:hypothetical protein n=1 Tax=Deinococcus sp. Marseille-Q6407 TaxID=2969223 RepID=UPI0021C18ABA|nr:hypothetical protein [Deinococcus sp. Marseille-Q6407]
MRRPLFVTALSLFALLPAAHAAPQGKWTEVSAGQWADPARQCTYRAERRGQAFPLLRDQASAARLAGALKTGLSRQGVRDIQVRPVLRGQTWGLFASYVYPSAQGEAQVAQLYLSQGGVLRTVTGSTRARTISALPPGRSQAAAALPATCWPDLARWIEFDAG